MISDKQLFIDEELIDLSEDTAVALTLQINNIANLVSRQGNLTNKFKIPITANNDKQLGFARKIESSSSKPYRKLSAKFIDAGIELIPNGYAIIEQAADFYNITVYSGNSDFFAQIEGKKMKDLDLSDLNHDWTLTNVFGSRNNTDDYIYAIINYGNMDDDGTSQIWTYESFPALFVHSLIKRIVEAVGWTLQGDILTHDMYINALLAWSNEKWEHSDLYIAGWHGISSASGQVINYTNHTPVVIAQLDIDDADNISSSIYTAPDYVKVDIDVTLVFSYTSGLPSAPTLSTVTDWNLKIENGVGGTVITTTASDTIKNSTTETLSISVSVKDHLMPAGDRLFFFFVQNLEVAFDFAITVTSFDVKIKVKNQIMKNANFDLAYQMPDMTQKDFMKGIMNIFAISPDGDSSTNTLYLRSFKEITDNLPVAKDWSDKLLEEKTSNISYRIGNYTQKNNCKWIQDDETDHVVTPLLGNSSFTIDDETLEPESDQIVLPFGASDMQKKFHLTGVLPRLDVPLIDKLEVILDVDRDVDSSGKSIRKTSPRILMLDRQTLDFNFSWKDGSTTSNSTSAPLCYFMLSGKDNNLGFDNLLDIFYPAILQIINKSKILNCYLQLTSKDIQNFDHFIPVYLSKYSANFYVNIIKNYKRGLITNAELIRL